MAGTAEGQDAFFVESVQGAVAVAVCACSSAGDVELEGAVCWAGRYCAFAVEGDAAAPGVGSFFCGEREGLFVFARGCEGAGEGFGAAVGAADEGSAAVAVAGGVCGVFEVEEADGDVAAVDLKENEDGED